MFMFMLSLGLITDDAQTQGQFAVAVRRENPLHVDKLPGLRGVIINQSEKMTEISLH